jgi:hypothetical protein
MRVKLNSGNFIAVSFRVGFAVRHSISILVLLCLTLMVVSGCSKPHRVQAVPNDLYTDAVIPGMPGIRYFVDEDPKPIVRDAVKAAKREKEHLASKGMFGPLPPAYLLAISGGGSDGAFGAGLLVGWTEAGTRPEFKIVTGVSIGALTAPFAFLGPEYDDQLRKVFTTISADDIRERRSFLDAIFGDGLSDTTPLWNLIRRYIDEQMLEAIAEEYSKGRLLFIATTNLDAQRSVIWNIGEIAKSGHPEALNLFRRILFASASIPGAFSPVMIDVEANGKRFQEMHVDGGTVAQVFIYPPSIKIEKVTKAYGVGRERVLYVIRNARLDPQWASVERSIFAISTRAIQSLIQAQGVGDLYVIYLQSQRDNLDYNLAFIPPDFNAPHKEIFDTDYMNQLFGYAYGLSKEGYPWEKYPPGYLPVN